ncbi:hypothetical protein CK203_097519 [Vitis vinifera]|uniref:Uncharacterized protein n=1 Tax=Vitis vinifera TaxID=29760 RepID=A0A438CWK3_VITVI|nr:hypothetical protein CK203_097519 [Vitis vinifera]
MYAFVRPSVRSLTITYHFFQDESVLIWLSGKEEKRLKLSHVSRIIPGQRTVSFSTSRSPTPLAWCILQ